jgi:hypothetical protein
MRVESRAEADSASAQNLVVLRMIVPENRYTLFRIMR